MNKTSLSLSLRIHYSGWNIDQRWHEPFAPSEACQKPGIGKLRQGQRSFWGVLRVRTQREICVRVPD
jgi:hypothetical protein